MAAPGLGRGARPRPAARMAARRMAGLLGENVGETVGYQVRFERKVGAGTRIEVLTEAAERLCKI